MANLRKGKLDDLTLDAENANAGSERGTYLLEESFQQCGAGRGVVADRHGNLIGGNKTVEAAAAVGISKVVFVETDGDELVVVQRRDLDLTDPSSPARKLAYFDNRASQVGLRWDAGQLAADLQAGLDLSGMFFREEVERLTAGLAGCETLDLSLLPPLPPLVPFAEQGPEAPDPAPAPGPGTPTERATLPEKPLLAAGAGGSGPPPSGAAGGGRRGAAKFQRGDPFVYEVTVDYREQGTLPSARDAVVLDARVVTPDGTVTDASLSVLKTGEVVVMVERDGKEVHGYLLRAPGETGTEGAEWPS